MKRLFPMEILLIDQLAYDGEGTHCGLHKHLRHQPAVRTFGIVTSVEKAYSYLTNKATNVIFVSISSFRNNAFWSQLETFLLSVKEKNRNIMVVFYGEKAWHETFVNEHPIFKKYFFCEAMFGTEEDINKDKSNLPEHELEAMEREFRKFEAWLKNRFQFDVCISYASENLAEAKAVYDGLLELGNKPFLGEAEKPELLGNDLKNNLY